MAFASQLLSLKYVARAADNNETPKMESKLFNIRFDLQCAFCHALVSVVFQEQHSLNQSSDMGPGVLLFLKRIEMTRHRSYCVMLDSFCRT